MSNAPSKPVSFSRPKVGYVSNRPRNGTVHADRYIAVLYMQTDIYSGTVHADRYIAVLYIQTDIHFLSYLAQFFLE